MSTFRFVHAADLHLDTPFEGVGRVDPAVRDALRDASLDAWDDLVGLTIARAASFLVLAGDIYDGAQRGMRAQLRFVRGLERLSAHGIQTFIVHGNHDPLDGWSAIRVWPAGVTVFGSAGVEAIAVERGGVRLATVYGVSYGRPDVSDNLARLFRRGAAPGLHIGVLHCNVGGVQEHAPYSPCTLDDLRAAGMDYWALGHIHKRQVVAEDQPWVVYPGNLQGRGTKTSELGAKGATVVEVVDGRISELTFAPVDRIRFLHCAVDVSGCRDVGEVRAAIWNQATALHAQHADRGLLVHVLLHGRGRLGADLHPWIIDDLLRDLREQASERTPFLWWRHIDTAVRDEIDRDVIRSRGDFSAELMRTRAALADSAARRETLLRDCWESLSDRNLGRYAAALDSDDEARVLEAAEALALQLLQDEDAT
jgi:DNA repair exonuclease SbcCD nuclease subunit